MTTFEDTEILRRLSNEDGFERSLTADISTA